MMLSHSVGSGRSMVQVPKRCDQLVFIDIHQWGSGVSSECGGTVGIILEERGPWRHDLSEPEN